MRESDDAVRETWEGLATQLRGLAEGEPGWLPVLSNASALLMDGLDGLNWAGFYLVDGHGLVLGPFQGKLACVRIALGRGVCGTAAAADEAQLVPDVHAFPGHIACDAASRSELVVPLHHEGRVIGVLDMDSPSAARFGEADLEGALGFVAVLEAVCDWSGLPAGA